MLAVGVHLHGAVVVIFGGKAQPGLECTCQPQVDRQIDEAIAVGAADSRRFVAAAIVDDDIKPEAFDAVDGLADRYRFYVENRADRTVVDAAYAACWRRYLFLCAKVRQAPTPELVKAISKEQFLMQGLISYLPNCRNMKMTEKLSAARWAMMSAQSLCPIK